MKDLRSTIDPQNIQEILDASATPKAAIQAGQQQYSTPPAFARAMVDLLPSRDPRSAFDPQCAGGNLLHHFYGGTELLGADIDARHASHVDKDDEDGGLVARPDGVTCIRTNCVRLWEHMDDLFPHFTPHCHVANPPFGLRWKTRQGVMDSTEHTWQRLQERTPREGYGFMIANADTIERLAIHQHPDVYLYQRFPPGLWPGTVVQVGVVHWHKSESRYPTPLHVAYTTLELDEHESTLEPLREHYRSTWLDADGVTGQHESAEIWQHLAEVVAEERRGIPEHNVRLAPEGYLRVYLSTAEKIKRKLKPAEIESMLRMDRCHPVTLVPDVETRRILQGLIGEGAYTISREARRAIEHALSDATRLGAPILPVTDFERIAYVDECDMLTALPRVDSPWTGGQRYAVSTAVYRFSQKFTRKKSHVDPETGVEVWEDHDVELSGNDRYAALKDDEGRTHYFLAHPDTEQAPKGGTNHPEADIWEYFQRPEVRTVEQCHPDLVAAAQAALVAMQSA